VVPRVPAKAPSRLNILFLPDIVSSDYCRAMICDDVNNQQVNRDTFDLFYYIIQKRMFLGRFTVADSTALQSEARRKLRELITTIWLPGLPSHLQYPTGNLPGT